MCTLKGCSVSDSFFTVIGDKIELRRPVLAPSVLHAVIVVPSEENSVCNIHSTVQLFLAVQPFGRVAF